MEYSIGYTSSKGPFSIAMLVYHSVTGWCSTPHLVVLICSSFTIGKMKNPGRSFAIRLPHNPVFGLREFDSQNYGGHPIPIGSLYGIFTYIWLIFIVNVGKYTIHGLFGMGKVASPIQPIKHLSKTFFPLNRFRTLITNQLIYFDLRRH